MNFQEYYEAALRRGWFDSCFYFDVLRSEDLSIGDSGLSLFEHYATVGWKRGLSPSDRFTVQRYLAAYRDVAAQQVDPLYHFLARGHRERRKAFALFEPPAEVQYVGLIDARPDEAQLALAEANGISAFCIPYDGGVSSLADDLDPETSFCLMLDYGGSAGAGGASDGSLKAQYSLFHGILKLLSDRRYLRVGGKPLLVVATPERLDDAVLTFALWREAARQAGLGGVFVARLTPEVAESDVSGLDALIGEPETGDALPVFPGFVPQGSGTARAADAFAAWQSSAAEKTKDLGRRNLPRLAFVDARGRGAGGSQHFLAGAATERGQAALSRLGHFAEVVASSDRLPVLFLCDADDALIQRLIVALEKGDGLACFLLQDEAFSDLDGIGWSRVQTANYLAWLLRYRGDLVVVSQGAASGNLLAPFATRGHRIVSLNALPESGLDEIKRYAHRIIVGSESERSRLSASCAIAKDDIQLLQPPGEGSTQAWAGYVRDVRHMLAGLGNDGRRIRSTGGTAGRQKIAEDLCVVIPSFNHRAFIRAALDSVLAQSVRPREIRIIDDGSSDGSAELVQSLASDRLGVLVTARDNRGAHATINQGIAETDCPIVAVMDSDDRWHPLRIEELIGSLRPGGGADVVFSRLRFMGPQDKCAIKRDWYEAGVADYRNGSPLWLALMFCNFFFTTSNLLARRDRLLAVGGFGPLRYCHDLDYMLKAICAGHRVEFVEQTLCDYRVHAGNTVDRDVRKLLFEQAWIMVKFLRQRFGQMSVTDRLDVSRRIRDKGLATWVTGISQAVSHDAGALDDRLLYNAPRLVAVLNDNHFEAQDLAEPDHLVHALTQSFRVREPEPTPGMRG